MQNPSLKESANDGPPGVGQGYAEYCLSPVQSPTRKAAFWRGLGLAKNVHWKRIFSFSRPSSYIAFGLIDRRHDRRWAKRHLNMGRGSTAAF